MPAAHEDPDAPVIASPKEVPATICPRQVTLRDRVTVATLVPFSSADEVPRSLLSYLTEQLNREIEKGDTYPMIDPIPLERFGPYWFANFGAVMLLGDIKSVHDVQAMEHNRTDWTRICLGSFNIRPNYPGRSSHVCNGTFLVTDASRNKGVGRLMGEGYLEWAPKLGYSYSVFNLVYENNVASCRIWDSLGFKRIGKVPGCGSLRSYPDQLVDGIIYGRDLGLEGEDSVTQERFDKIRYYLKHSKYPRGADRAEKSRLRSAATHYKLLGGENGEPERLMLKDKEVVSDPQQQYEIARQIHVQQHGGINKTTATIAVKYHWVRIKETVSRVIRDCPQCKETAKAPILNGNKITELPVPKPSGDLAIPTPDSAITPTELIADAANSHSDPFAQTNPSGVEHPDDCMTDYTNLPLDPQIIDISPHLTRFQHHQSITDPYEHQNHGLPHVEFDDELRAHGHSDYHAMVNDESDSDALQRDALGLVNAQLTDSQHEQEILSRYVDRSEDELDFT
ncbi:putative histone acetyltransferase Spt10 [Talaromyces proteolyticus]|uniref:Histone acetyltransferase Spt10 n=1 Tax=Talaromyces proteolyticus TaxID=1131652 RepID=A0AAD4PXX9_9EURO|nr:putative histone acetyltransferase Spt10 [Talaromyces proteolyticus]KAH8697139.1 putative histone acetyltransferase Spt10 [Talaromyces proteolyticus]